MDIGKPQKTESEKLLHFAMLYDFYGELLTEKQRMFFEMYHFQDLSLNEIGQELGITAQAVRDLLKRTENNLLDYEKALRLIERHKSLKLKISELLEIADMFPGLTEPEHNLLKDGIISLLE